MYIPSAQMGEYDSVKPPPQKRMSSKQMLDSRYGGGASVERQSSSGRFSGVERTTSRGRLENSGGGSMTRTNSSGGMRLERQDSRAKVTRQGSSSRLERQESRGRMTPRQSSQRQLVRSDSHHGHSHSHGHSCGQHGGAQSEVGGQSDVERQIRRLASSGKFSQDQRSNVVRDTYQTNTKAGWQNSLRGSSASDPRGERGGGAARPRSDRNTQPEYRQRSARSESGSPSGRLFASTFSSRAKKSEQRDEEEFRLTRRNSRASRSPQRSRSRANSVSQEDRVTTRRSQSKTPGRTSSVSKRRSVSNVTDEEDGAVEDTDPFLTYRSFKQFQNEEGTSGSLKREKSKSSASYSERMLSNSLSGAKISNTSSGYDSFKLDSSPFDSKPYTPAKLSSDGRNGLGGIFSSTPKYQDSTDDTSLARHSSSSMFSNGDSGFSASSSSFSSFSSSTISKRNSGVFSSDVSGGKISLGSLKKPSTESWDSSSSSMLRRGVSSTYIG